MEMFQPYRTQLQSRRRFIRTLKFPSEEFTTEPAPQQEHRPLSKLTHHGSLLSQYKPKILSQLRPEDVSELLNRSEADDSDHETHLSYADDSSVVSDSKSFRSDISLPVCRLRRTVLTSSFLRIYRPVLRYKNEIIWKGKDNGSIRQPSDRDTATRVYTPIRRSSGLLSSFRSPGSTRYMSLPKRQPLFNVKPRTSANKTRVDESHVDNDTPISDFLDSVEMDMSRFTELSQLYRSSQNASNASISTPVSPANIPLPKTHPVDVVKSTDTHAHAPSATSDASGSIRIKSNSPEVPRRNQNIFKILATAFRKSPRRRKKKGTLNEDLKMHNDKPKQQERVVFWKRFKTNIQKAPSLDKKTKLVSLRQRLSRRNKIRLSSKRLKAKKSEFDELNGDFRNVLKKKRRSEEHVISSEENQAKGLGNKRSTDAGRYVTVITVTPSGKVSPEKRVSSYDVSVSESKTKPSMNKGNHGENDLSKEQKDKKTKPEPALTKNIAQKENSKQLPKFTKQESNKTDSTDSGYEHRLEHDSKISQPVSKMFSKTSVKPQKHAKQLDKKHGKDGKIMNQKSPFQIELEERIKEFQVRAQQKAVSSGNEDEVCVNETV